MVTIFLVSATNGFCVSQEKPLERMVRLKKRKEGRMGGAK